MSSGLIVLGDSFPEVDVLQWAGRGGGGVLGGNLQGGVGNCLWGVTFRG